MYIPVFPSLALMIGQRFSLVSAVHIEGKHLLLKLFLAQWKAESCPASLLDIQK
jgi:hypothetical protein